MAQENPPQYYIAIREKKEIGFVLKARTDASYVGQPKTFCWNDVLREYADAVVKYGADNVEVSEVKYLRLVGHVEEIPADASLPWAQAGKFNYQDPK